jgi:hypothetical protein
MLAMYFFFTSCLFLFSLKFYKFSFILIEGLIFLAGFYLLNEILEFNLFYEFDA